MRITNAWAQVASQNTVLKTAIAVFALVTTALTMVVLRLSDRPPLIIDRGCHTATISPGSDARSKSEIEAFVRDALTRRFDSKAEPSAGYLSQDEEAARQQEQAELRPTQLTQRVIVNSVEIGKDTVRVDADRLITLGRVRSAFSFPLEVTVATVNRSAANPSGLQVTKSTPVKTSEEPTRQEEK